MSYIIFTREQFRSNCNSLEKVKLVVTPLENLSAFEFVEFVEFVGFIGFVEFVEFDRSRGTNESSRRTPNQIARWVEPPETVTVSNTPTRRAELVSCPVVALP